MSKTRDTGFLANVIQVHDTGVRIMSGSNMLMAISSSGAVTITGELSGSDAANSLLLDGTGSLAFTTTASYNAFSASYGIASASLSTRTTQVERTYATTGSNTFTGPQYISNTSNAIGFTSTASLYSDGGLRVQGNSFVSGTAYFNNIVVYGTSSIQYITSSQVNIGANIITVNTDTPAVRFGGLSVFDSGSTQLTGSILWDSEKNHWVYSNPSGSSYSGGMLISGPRSSALGSEQGTTACMLLVGQGSDHLTSSMIYHDSARTCFYTNATLACSNTFGSNLNSIQTFTGSVVITGSLTVNTTGTEFQVNNNGVTIGNLQADNHSITGSLRITGSSTILGNLSIGNTNTTSSITITGNPVGGFTVGNIYWGRGNQVCAGLSIDSPGTNIEMSTGFNERLVFSTGTGLQVFTNNGSGTYTSRMLLDRCGNVCFSGIVCAPSAAFPTSVVVGATSLKSYSSLTAAGQIISLSNIGVDAGQSIRLNNYYNSGTVTDRTISNGYAAAIGLDNSVGAMTFATSTVCVAADNNVTVSERMRITNCGNIGINFPTPSFPLTRSGMTMKAATNDGAEFVMLSCADTGFIGGALVRNACDFGVINRTNGNLIFATNAQERLYITGAGIACFSCTICSGGSIVRKGFDSHTVGQWYKIPFYIDKNTPSGTATTKCLIIIDNNDAFQELHFTIEYGSRLQGFSDQYTQTSLRSYGVNRFNSSTITLNDAYLLTGGSGCAINTHAPMTVAVVGNCMSVVKVDFSSTVGNSSFVWGEVRIWSIESLTNKITISNNAY